MNAELGQPAPALEVERWVQGGPIVLSEQLGRVVLIELFQVNCPGCFLHGLPQAMALEHRFMARGLTVAGVATAFEDFAVNTLENLLLLVECGEVVGETRRMLTEYGLLDGGRLPFGLEFPIAMDRLTPIERSVSDDHVHAFIDEHLPDRGHLGEAEQAALHAKVREHLEQQRFVPRTFARYGLMGTPSAILIDRDGILRHAALGHDESLEKRVEDLLAE